MSDLWGQVISPRRKQVVSADQSQADIRIEAMKLDVAKQAVSKHVAENSKGAIQSRTVISLLISVFSFSVSKAAQMGVIPEVLGNPVVVQVLADGATVVAIGAAAHFRVIAKKFIK